MRIAHVVLDSAAPAYDHAYTYRLPENVNASAGCRVLVPFGRGDRLRIALVCSVEDGEPPKRCKDIASALDEQPLLNEEGLFLLHVLVATTFCTWGDALHTLIPPGAGMRLSWGLSPVRGLDDEVLSADAALLYRYLLRRRTVARQEDALAACGLTENAPALAELLENGFVMRQELVKKRIADERAAMARLREDAPDTKLTQKQQAVVDFLAGCGCATVREIGYFTGVTRAVVDRLERLGVVEIYEEIMPRAVPDSDKAAADPAPIVLSGGQQRAYDTLETQLDSGEASVSLLYGVTGSGKTQVYLKLIERALAQGRQALVLIPEISLTPQAASIFSARFGGRVAVLHSALSVSERLDEWNRIRQGKAQVVVGTRSAVFAPLADVGLIVIDEEQERAYHSEKSPRYDAREIARLRAQRHGALLLLCSATPSIESMYAAESGKIKLVRLSERFSTFGLPEVETIDLRTAPIAHGCTLITEELGEQLCEVVARGEQAILLLNRRGYNTLVKCPACGETARCPHCSIPLTYHSANGRLVCHYCGYSKVSTDPCEKCGAKLLRYMGAGTQRAEEELQTLLPDARILRLDADTTMSRFSHRDKFAAFAAGEYDVMIGTQMVAKGLDFPNVTLVGVLCADQSLYSEDFRAFERTFSLVTQVVGRCGRAEKPGRAVIQTYSPEHRVLELAAAQDYDNFYREEIGYRRVGLYPPFCDMVCFVFASEQEQLAVESARRFAKCFAEVAAGQPDIPLRLLGPAECTPYRVAGRYRCRILIKCRNNRRFRALVRDVLQRSSAGQESVYPAIDCRYDSNL